MKALAGVLAASFLALATSMALADEATGTIQSVDPQSMTVTLEDGTAYTLPADFDASTIQAGDTVTITFSVENGANMATEVAPSN